MADKDKAVQKAEELEQNYPAIHSDMEQFSEVLQANLGDFQNLSPFDLQRIGMPTSGGTKFTVPKVTGPETTEALDVIIAAWHSCRAYWPGAFSGSEPPQCSSPDGVQGFGEPGGECATCEFAQWDSAEEGSGQACKQMKRLFGALPESMVPYVLTLPPTSIGNFSNYLVGLAGVQVPYWTVQTRVELETDKNNDGVEYAVATFQLLKQLGGEERERACKFHEMVMPLAKSPDPAGAEDYAGGEAD